MKYFIGILVLTTVAVTATVKQVEKSLVVSNTWDSKESMHDYYTKEFVKSPGFGMRRVEFMDDSHKTFVYKGNNHRVKGIELVSVTDRKKPVLWLTGRQPSRMALEKGLIKKRYLTDAEKKSFGRLEEGEDFVLTSEGTTPKLMGALRATASCIKCHDDYKKGELMGAFKYTFFPTRDFKKVTAKK